MEVAGINEVHRQVGDGIGEFTVDWSSPGSIPWRRRRRTSWRI
jgi:hypothetical protein